jgi:mannose-6-phosphate isomerase-like protein (cupin superfamily)
MTVEQRARLRHQEEIEALPLQGARLQQLVDRDLGAEHVMSYRLTVDPKASASHSHAGVEEALYVVQGLGEIRVETSSYPVRRGQAVFVPAGAEHSYRNSGVERLIIVGALAPPVASADPAVAPALMDEQRIPPTVMGERNFRVLVSPEVGCRSMTQFTGIIPTGHAPLHAHPHEEAVYIISGRGRLWIEDQSVGELRPGSVVFFPIGVRHTLENTGEEPLKVLGAFSPAGSPEAKLPSK